MTTVWRLLIQEPDITLPWMTHKGRIAIGWGEIGDIRVLETPEAIAQAIRDRNERHPDHAGKAAANIQHGTNSLYDFCFRMKTRELVIISDGTKRQSVWEVAGEYEYAQPSEAPLNYQHQRLARALDLDADELWLKAGVRLADGQINFQTLGRCANEIE